VLQSPRHAILQSLERTKLVRDAPLNPQPRSQVRLLRVQCAMAGYAAMAPQFGSGKNHDE
jgi:hypothetical protein